MIKKEILRMAREAGVFITHYNPVLHSATPEALERFFQAAYAAGAAAEREACAKVCEELDLYSSYECAAAIRARGQA